MITTKFNKSEQGFTLIELLVVIAIIGMLSSVVLASMNTARKKARDARRMADAKSLQTALELYYDDHSSSYPTATNYTPVTSTLTGLVPDDISKLPIDPTNEGIEAYLYCSSTNASYGYAIAIQRETTGGGGWCQFKVGNGCSTDDTLTICTQ